MRRQANNASRACADVNVLLAEAIPMKIIPFDIDLYSGVRCPDSDIEIDFQDEDITDYLDETFVLAVISSVCPETCATGGSLNDAWMKFYEEHDDESLEDKIKAFPGPYQAIEVSRSGMACGPVGETTYFVVPQDSVIEPIPR
jgi:hypothetical protein